MTSQEFWLLLVQVLAQNDGAAGGAAGAEKAAAPLPPGGGMMSFLIPMAAIFFIFWFLVFRPESRRRKELARRIGSIAKGDRVATIGGILAEVVRVDASEVVLQVDKEKKVNIRVRKSAIGEVLTEAGTSAPVSGPAAKDEATAPAAKESQPLKA
jgi:preprotein translocase subunit YajC